MMIAVFWLCLGAREALNLLPTSLAARVGIVSVIAALTVSMRLHGMWISRRAHPLQNSAPWAANVLRHLSPAATVFADWRQLYALRYEALKENPDKPLTLLEAFPDSSRGYFILPEAYREVLDLGGRSVPVYLLMPPIGSFRKYLWTDIGGGSLETDFIVGVAPSGPIYFVLCIPLKQYNADVVFSSDQQTCIFWPAGLTAYFELSSFRRRDRDRSQQQSNCGIAIFVYQRQFALRRYADRN